MTTGMSTMHLQVSTAFTSTDIVPPYPVCYQLWIASVEQSKLIVKGKKGGAKATLLGDDKL